MAKRKTQSDDVDGLLHWMNYSSLMIRELELALTQSKRKPQRRDIDVLDELGKCLACCEIFLERLQEVDIKLDEDVDVLNLEVMVEALSGRYRAVFLAFCQRLKVDATITVSEGSATEALEAFFRPGSIEVFDNLRAAILKPAEAEDSRLVTAKEIALKLEIERGSLLTKNWPDPKIRSRGNKPSQYRWEDLKPILQQQYPREDWNSF